MPLNNHQRLLIEKVIVESIRRKFATYRPETIDMPFHYRLIGRDRMRLYSFIQSLNTTFGTSIFEPIAEILAGLYFKQTQKHYTVGDTISEAAQQEIQHIMNDLTTGKNKSIKSEEIDRIRKVCLVERMNKLRPVKADLFIEDNNGAVFMIELKTAKPNIGNFKDFKRTLLEWIAIYLSRDPLGKVNSFIAIPYNPYEPKPYERWTLYGILDLDHELKVGDEFWDFLGGDGTYEEILDCFERAGITLSPEFDAFFAKFK